MKNYATWTTDTFHPKMSSKIALEVESESFMFRKKLFESYVPRNSFLVI